jgi:nucleoid DNA-binding protein
MTKFGFQNQLVNDIAELLDIPNPKARLIVQAIHRSMSAALRNGDDVFIRGFGKFHVAVSPPRRTGNNFVSSTVHSPVPMVSAPKTIVRFIPAQQLRAMVNNPTTNYDEARAKAIWPTE